MAIRTYYDDLNVARTATLQEIKRAYRKLCNIHHPDKNLGGDKAEQNRILAVLNEAYKVLSKPESRRKHDEWIAHRELCERNAERDRKEREEAAFRKRQAQEEAKREEEKRWKKETEEAAFRKEKEDQARREARERARREEDLKKARKAAEERARKEAQEKYQREADEKYKREAQERYQRERERERKEWERKQWESDIRKAKKEQEKNQQKSEEKKTEENRTGGYDEREWHYTPEREYHRNKKQESPPTWLEKIISSIWRKYPIDLLCFIIPAIFIVIVYAVDERTETKSSTMASTQYTASHSQPQYIQPKVQPQLQPTKGYKYTVGNAAIVRNTATQKPNLTIYDLYYDIHAREFDVETSKVILNGYFKNDHTCDNVTYNDIRQVEIIYHFLKGGKRVHTQVSLKYLCGLE